MTYIRELVVEGVGKETLKTMIKEEGSRLRAADGITALHDTDARYFPSKGTVKGIIDRATRGRRQTFTSLLDTGICLDPRHGDS